MFLERSINNFPPFPYDSPQMLAPILTLVWVLLLTGLLLTLATILIMAFVLLHPPRMTDGRAAWRLKRLTPGDLRLHYSELTFKIHDEQTSKPINLAAWWIPHPKANGRCAILLHGYGDAKVGAIAWAPTLHALNFNLLALDLRAHGQSQGRHSTAGYFERHDVSQVIDQLKLDNPDDTRQIILFGISLGAAVAAATAVMRNDIAAVILECPFPDYRLAAASHANILGSPGPAIQNAAFAVAQKISKADFHALRPVDLIPRIPCPLMVIRSDADVFIDNAHAALIEEATNGRPESLAPTTYWNAQNAHHVAALYEDPEAYKQRIAAFLDQALRQNPTH
jgi:pimeloyl-ACP methyl ester carboxylesterase